MDLLSPEENILSVAGVHRPAVHCSFSNTSDDVTHIFKGQTIHNTPRSCTNNKHRYIVVSYLFGMSQLPRSAVFYSVSFNFQTDPVPVTLPCLSLPTNYRSGQDGDCQRAPFRLRFQNKMATRLLY